MDFVAAAGYLWCYTIMWTGWLVGCSPRLIHLLLIHCFRRPGGGEREERGRRCKEPTLYGGVLVHCAVYTGDVLKIPNVFWSQCVCTVHSPALSRTWHFGKMVITYQLTGNHFSPTSIHSHTICEPNNKKTAHLHIFCTLPIAYYLRSDSWFKGKGRFKLGPLVRNAVIPGMHKCLEMRVKLFAPSCNQQCTL